MYRSVLSVVAFLATCGSLFSQKNIQKQQTTLGVTYTEFTPNNNAIWFSNNGDVAYHQPTGKRGWEYPRGSGKCVGFETGFVWSGRVLGNIRTGGSTFRHGLQPGKLDDQTGIPFNSNDPRYKIYYIKRSDTSGANPDYAAWPAADGAPMMNNKPQFFGDEQLWFVANDKNPALTTNLYGTQPIGLEVQTTVWGSDSPTDLADVVFVKHLIINKSADNYTDVYMGIWTDFDIGYDQDDLVGVDASIGLSYGYNGNQTDQQYGVPPAAGVMFLQTPVVPSSGDTVLFNGRKRSGYTYSPLSSYAFYITGNATYLDPELGSAAGSVMMYNNLRGYQWNDLPYVDPWKLSVTKFPLSGDPSLRIGWLDGIKFPPGDRRSLLSTGPVTIAAKDTQEVVYAMFVQRGADRIESVKLLREYAMALEIMHRTQSAFVTPPKLRVDASYPNLNTVKLEFDMIDSTALSCKAMMLRADKTLFEEVQMFDDGLHNDGAANDHRFHAEWTGTVVSDGIDVYFDVEYPENYSRRWYVRKCVPLCGDVRIVDAHVESGQFNEDGKANPGETVRITLSVKNETKFTLGDSDCIRMENSAPTNDIYRIDSPFAPGATLRRNYADTGSYRFTTVEIPSTLTQGDFFKIKFLLQDTLNNCWMDSISIPIYTAPFVPIDSLAIHLAGGGSGTLGYRIIDPLAWKNRIYKVIITGHDSINPTLSIYDLSSNQILADNVFLPDILGFDSPIVGGFRLNLGTAVKPIASEADPTKMAVPPLHYEYRPQANEWLAPVPNVGWMAGQDFFGSALTAIDLVPIKLVFSQTNQQKGYVYLRGGTPNYVFKGMGTVPFRAFDMSGAAQPRQLNVAFVEMNNTPSNDMKWFPTTSNSSREYLFIFKSNYSEAVDTFYANKPLLTNISNLDVLYAAFLMRTSESATYKEGDEIHIIPSVPISILDTFLINPKGTLAGTPRIPRTSGFELHQNYPNPFSSTTSITYSFAEKRYVRLSVYDLLGRKIVTLIDGPQEGGMHRYVFDPERAGFRLSNGLYWYQLEVDGIAQRRLMTMMK